MSVNKYLEGQVRESFEDWQEKFNDEFNLRLDIKIEFTITGTNLGGQACYSRNIIRFNPNWMNHNILVYLRTTVPHEIAHFAAKEKFNATGHGQEWKHVMRTMGLHPNRTNKDFSCVKIVHGRKMKMFGYVLPCGCKFEVSAVIHKRIQGVIRKRIQGGQNRICKSHKTRVLPEHFVEKTQ